MSIKKVPKSSELYVCELCHYSTSRKSQYDRHITTDKHKINELAINVNELSIEKVPNHIICSFCEKKYKDPSGLWRHKKKCKVVINKDISTKESIKIDNEQADKELIMILIKENSDLKSMMMETQTMMMEVIKNGTHNTNSHNTNSHNKTFNLQLFLNETCKDAMNIMDFVDSIKIQLTDLEKVGQIGFVEGISNIINTNLKALDVTQRPIHCTDKKRETLYIKDENKWEKENENKSKLRKVIKQIAHKNSKLVPQFKEAHPDCGKSVSKFSDQYNKIIIEAMGGSGDNDNEKEDKIIKNISNFVTIDKEVK